MEPQATLERLIGRSVEYRFEKLPVGLLSIDHRYQKYQRVINDRRLSEMIQEFDPVFLGVIYVSERDNGGWYVIDGQHRCEAAKRTHGVEFECACYVYNGLTYQEEARLFKKLNVNRGPVSSAARINADLEGEMPVALEMRRAVEDSGFTLSFNGGGNISANALKCVAALEKIYKRHGREGLMKVLRILRAAWLGERDVRHTLIVSGVGDFVERYADVYAETLLIEKLSRTSPTKMLRDASLLGYLNGSGIKRVSLAVWGAYNHKLRLNRLPNRYNADDSAAPDDQ